MPTVQPAPLAEIKVIDLTRLLPGPLCGQYLADLGAEVIKIEDTHAGDYARPSLRQMVNRGKKSLRLNLKTQKGKEIFMALVAKSDVLIESFRPGTMQRLELDYQRLSAINPRLVYCAISGYGQTGPRSQAAGHDINFQALTGVLEQTGTPFSPTIPGFLIGDIAGGTLTASIGILTALLAAQRTGQGRFIDVSMADSMLSLSVLPIALLNEGAPGAPRGSGNHTGGTAHYNVYETLDARHLAVGAQEKKFWDTFCTAIGQPELKARHSHSADKNADLKIQVSQVIKTRTLNEWVDVFQGNDCCVSPVLHINEALQDPHFHTRGVVERVENNYRIGLPFQLSGHEVNFQRAVPDQGAHTHEILAEMGYDTAHIAQLLQDDVVAGLKQPSTPHR